MRTEAEILADRDLIEARIQSNKDSNETQRRLQGVWVRLDQELEDVRSRTTAVKTTREAELNAAKTELESVKTDLSASPTLQSYIDDGIDEIDELKVLSSRKVIEVTR